MRVENRSIFSLKSSRPFAADVAKQLNLALGDHEERDFEDGEHKTRPLVSVRGRNVYVIESLYSDQEQSVNDKLCRLLFFLGALRDASAASVTAVIPYLCYARKDRKTKSRDPVTTRYVARLIESMGVARVVTLDVHNLAAFQNAFTIPTDHLEAMPLFVEHLIPLAREVDVTIVSPDVGGAKRAKSFGGVLSQLLDKEVPIALMEKQRSAGVVSGDAFIGDVENRTVIILDDLISSGTTIVRAARACLARGATRVLAMATHGLFAGDAEEVLGDAALERVIVTNSIPPVGLSSDFVGRKLTVLDAAPLVAEAIRRIDEGGSLVELLQPRQSLDAEEEL